MPKESPKDEKEFSLTDISGVEEQIDAEYNQAWKHQKPKKDVAHLRLKLYNNQKRDPDAVGDSTMFTMHQTVLAALYDDRLMSTFVGREEGDDEVADNLDAMAEYDHDDMGKDITDFNWIWDTLFFGRGILRLEEYERDPDKGIYLPIPEVIDPVIFLHDIRAVSIHGNRQAKGACRYFGSEINMSEQEIEELPGRLDSFAMSELSSESGSKSLLKDAEEARNLAQGRQTIKMEGESKLGDNALYAITEWYTQRKINGEIKKVKVWSANERSKTIGFKVLDNQDYWPIIDRPMYPTSHDWDGTSLTDLTEDKQRAKAIAINLGMKAMQADLYPSYIFDSTKITNRAELTRSGFNKYIPVDSKGENLNTAIMPLIKARPNMQLLNFILESIDISAQKAAATPDIQQGIQSEKDRPLGETNLIKSGVDTRYSLSAKVFGWSERTFWQQWYRMYKDHFKEDIDEKIIRLQGVFGAKWRPLTKADITLRLDPNVKIESMAVSRSNQIEERNSLTQYFGLALQEPTSNRRWGLKKLAKLHGLKKDEIDRLFPQTIDERIAEDENELLSEDEITDVLADDDHNVHLEVHSKAADTSATYAHIETHKQALSMKQVMPELFSQDPAITDFQKPGTESLLPQQQTKQRSLTPSQASGVK